MLDAGTPPHGTVNTYVNHKCRCTPCNDAHTTYGRDRRRNIAYGRHDPMTDATEAQLHIKQLRADGMTIPHIAHHAGLAPHIIASVHLGRRTKASNITAILNVPSIPTRINHHPATAATRRIQGLQLQGWTIADIATAGNVSVDSIRHVIQRKNRTVTIPVHEAVERAARRLVDRNPPDTPTTRRIAGRAASRGYQSLLAWDDIDNPDETPTLDAPPENGVHILAYSRLDPDLIARIWRLRAQGLVDREIGPLVGMTPSAVCKLRARYPRKDTP